MDINYIKFGYSKKNLILNDINIVFPKGKITSIIGPNGCGKSTLLSLILKQNKLMGGSILINNKNIYNVKGKKFAKQIAGVSQINDGENDITVEEIVAYGRSPHKNGLAHLNEYDYKIINKALKLTSLENMRDKRLCSMSGGEKQRVYIAMALCQEPKFLLLDEPTSYLDIHYQLEVLNIIKKINEKAKITIIMVITISTKLCITAII